MGRRPQASEIIAANTDYILDAFKNGTDKKLLAEELDISLGSIYNVAKRFAPKLIGSTSQATTSQKSTSKTNGSNSSAIQTFNDTLNFESRFSALVDKYHLNRTLIDTALEKYNVDQLVKVLKIVRKDESVFREWLKTSSNGRYTLEISRFVDQFKRGQTVEEIAGSLYSVELVTFVLVAVLSEDVVFGKQAIPTPIIRSSIKPASLEIAEPMYGNKRSKLIVSADTLAEELDELGSIYELAKKYNVNSSTIYRCFKKAGYKLNKVDADL